MISECESPAPCSRSARVMKGLPRAAGQHSRAKLSAATRLDAVVPQPGELLVGLRQTGMDLLGSQAFPVPAGWLQSGTGAAIRIGLARCRRAESWCPGRRVSSRSWARHRPARVRVDRSALGAEVAVHVEQDGAPGDYQGGGVADAQQLVAGHGARLRRFRRTVLARVSQLCDCWVPCCQDGFGLLGCGVCAGTLGNARGDQHPA